jgi:tetratricopeptide (TPR) repeat protein
MLGTIQRNQGEYTEAVAFDEKSIEIHQKILPADYPHLITAYRNIGLVYGEYSKALPLFEKTWKPVKKLFLKIIRIWCVPLEKNEKDFFFALLIALMTSSVENKYVGLSIFVSN